jgi:hypothetical protein
VDGPQLPAGKKTGAGHTEITAFRRALVS